MGISTVAKAWDCTQELSTTVLGLRVQALLEVVFFAEFILLLYNSGIDSGINVSIPTLTLHAPNSAIVFLQ